MSANAKRQRAPGRGAARLAAVQALYQQEMEGTPLPKLLDEFHQHRIGAEIEDEQYIHAEIDYFDDIVRGVAARREEIDALVEAHLSKGWTLDRLDRPLRQIARAGAYELLARIDSTAGVIIQSYLDVADAFYEKREIGFINGVLDAIAKQVRETPAK